MCQHKELVLITANRNHDGEDSLEATIRRENTPHSLPVLTLADADRILFILFDPVYADHVAEKLLQYLLEIDLVRGTGRLYLP